MVIFLVPLFSFALTILGPPTRVFLVLTVWFHIVLHGLVRLAVSCAIGVVCSCLCPSAAMCCACLLRSPQKTHGFVRVFRFRFFYEPLSLVMDPVAWHGALILNFIPHSAPPSFNYLVGFLCHLSENTYLFSAGDFVFPFIGLAGSPHQLPSFLVAGSIWFFGLCYPRENVWLLSHVYVPLLTQMCFCFTCLLSLDYASGCLLPPVSMSSSFAHMLLF